MKHLNSQRLPYFSHDFNAIFKLKLLLSVTDRRGNTKFLKQTLSDAYFQSIKAFCTSEPSTPPKHLNRTDVSKDGIELCWCCRVRCFQLLKLPISFWLEAFSTHAILRTINQSVSTHGKTAWENLDKMKEKGDPVFPGGILSTQSEGYRVYTIEHGCLVPQGQKASDYDNSDPVPPRQNVVPSAEKSDTHTRSSEKFKPSKKLCMDFKASSKALALPGGYSSLCDKLVSWMSKKQNCDCNVFTEAEVRGVICQLCFQVNVDEDTASRLWLSNNTTNTMYYCNSQVSH
ncbi:hypothetical protein Tco_0820365 [Tanacetum coccineum]|uniref:Uncharacterized protein n=1 Tax=Tanacetum coccineum TaxID=301880 RepID=A0ABQ5A991_9ASTR